MRPSRCRSKNRSAAQELRKPVESVQREGDPPLKVSGEEMVRPSRGSLANDLASPAADEAMNEISKGILVKLGFPSLVPSQHGANTGPTRGRQGSPLPYFLPYFGQVPCFHLTFYST